MKTIVVSIGNSDNKLTQAQWSEFVNDVNRAVSGHGKAVHFFGGAANWMPWQNVAWIVDCNDESVSFLKADLIGWRKAYGQDSVAWIEGETLFL